MSPLLAREISLASALAVGEPSPLSIINDTGWFLIAVLFFGSADRFALTLSEPGAVEM